MDFIIIGVLAVTGICDTMRDDPEWIGAIKEIEADITDQGQWYEKQKDDPLF